MIARLAVFATLTTVLAGAVVHPAQAATATVGNGITTTDLNAVGMTTTSLASALVGPGVTVSNVTYTGANAQAGGIHIVDPAVVSFNDGVILSSGNVADVVGPNKSDGITGDMVGPGDADLTTLIANTQTVNPATFDAASLEFDFVPAASQVYFTYTFGSDEYLEWVNLFNDVFAFYVNGQNCATVPDGSPVSIDTINSAVNPNLFRDNSFSSPPTNPINIESDGLSVEMICSAPVNPGVTNHMKLAIADTSDQILDSVVMIKAGSLSTTKPESCNDGVDNDDDLKVDMEDTQCQATTTPAPVGSSGIGSANTAPPFTGNEGTPIPLDASALDWTPSADTVATSWTVTGINGTAGTCDISPAGRQPLNPDGSVAVVTTTCPNEGEYVARVDGWDVEGGAAYDTDVDFFVHNAPPAVTIDTPTAGTQPAPGIPVDVSATVTDPGVNDAVTCSISWGDGSSEAGTLVGGDCTGSHTYATAGAQVLSVTATDDAGDSSAAASILDVVTAGSLAGTVTAGGSPVGGVTVAAYAESDGWAPTALATTGPDGTYLLGGLPDGSYRVAFVPQADPGLGAAWYGGATRWVATPLDITATTALTGVDGDLPALSSVSGTVTDAGGAPVDGVIVAAYADTDGYFPTTWATTGPEGTYELADAPTGTYRLAFVPPAASGLRIMWDSATTSRATATPHTITPGTVLTGVDAQLPLTTAITGKVTGPGGAAVAGAWVWAYRATDGWFGTALTATGADGTYRLAGLPAATYRVFVFPPAGSGLSARWYGNTTSRAAGTQVLVADATVVGGIDVALP